MLFRSAQAAAKAAADPTNQFIATLNSMMYQQLAQQVTNSIFGNGSNHGVISVGANTIQWQKNLPSWKGIYDHHGLHLCLHRKLICFYT